MHRINKTIIALSLIVLTLLSITSCDTGGKSDSKSGFSIKFIDVGQGDAALVSCDGHYMLIDGGPKGAADKVYNALVDEKATKLDYLIVSHMHEDHIGGLQKALSYVSKVSKTLSVESDDDSEEYYDFHSELLTVGCSSIDVPKEGQKFSLGSSTIEIIAVGDPTMNNNESLVVLITYGSTTFLFTGDMQYQTEDKISDKYSDNFPITLLKVAHHGAENSTEYRFVRATSPKYAIISVGGGNRYGHPTEKVLSVLEQADVKTYRTDMNGTITVTSDGKELTIKTEK